VKFWLEKMVLWYKFGGTRTLSFKNNKVNVITGDSLTGKSAILQIFDYCLFASRSKLPEDTINANVSWYGIKFHINNKAFTIARTSLDKGKATSSYYFSQFGEVPEVPFSTHDEDTIKAILESEFGIDAKVTIAFGGKTIKLGSKISLRYFLLFNTISEDIITSSSIFFDKQDQSRYLEALPRIFDLAVGIETLENQLAREEKNKDLEEIRRLRRQLSRMANKKGDFDTERDSIIRRAREFGIFEAEGGDEMPLNSIMARIVSPDSFEPSFGSSARLSEIRNEIAFQLRIIRNLRVLKTEYNDYRKLLTTVTDSLKPVGFLRENMNDLVQTSIFDTLLKALELDFSRLKGDIQARVPIDTNVNDRIREREKSIESLRAEAASLPHDATSFESERSKFMFLGELKAKIELYGIGEESGDIASISSHIDELVARSEQIVVRDATDDREMFLNLLDEIMLDYMKLAGPAMGNYQGYLPIFDYKTKALHLRRPRTAHTENVGSSSNHMFLHLILFLGLHEAISIQRSRFVPSILFIDQPSRPYWGDGTKRKVTLDSSDEDKIRKAFELLNHFVQRMLVNDSGQCQVIVFEHVPPSTWYGLEHVFLVEKFTHRNALVNLSGRA